MGIYSNGSIFGIQIYNINDEDDVIHILYEEKYEEIMSHEQMREHEFEFELELEHYK